MQVNVWTTQVPLNVQRRRAAKAALEASKRVITVDELPVHWCVQSCFADDGITCRGAY